MEPVLGLFDWSGEQSDVTSPVPEVSNEDDMEAFAWASATQHLPFNAEKVASPLKRLSVPDDTNEPDRKRPCVVSCDDNHFFETDTHELRRVWEIALQERFELVETLSIARDRAKQQYDDAVEQFRFQLHRLSAVSFSLQQPLPPQQPTLIAEPSIVLDLTLPHVEDASVLLPLPTEPVSEPTAAFTANAPTPSPCPALTTPSESESGASGLTATTVEPSHDQLMEQALDLASLDKSQLIRLLHEQLRRRKHEGSKQTRNHKPIINTSRKPDVANAVIKMKKKTGRRPRFTIIKRKLDTLTTEEERASLTSLMPLQLPIDVFAEHRGCRITFRLDWQCKTAVFLQLLSIDKMAEPLLPEAQIRFNSYSRAYQMSVAYMRGELQKETSGVDRCFLALGGKEYTIAALKLLARRSGKELFQNPRCANGNVPADAHAEIIAAHAFETSLAEQAAAALPDVWKTRVPRIARPKNTFFVKPPPAVSIAEAMTRVVSPSADPLDEQSASGSSDDDDDEQA